MNIGIYAIKNILNGKRYVGSTTNLYRRWIQHKSYLNHNKHFNSYLQNAWNKYGSKSFIYEIIEECDKNILLNREEFWIKKCESYKDENGYNLCKTPRASRLGCKTSEETKNKLRIALGGKNHPLWGKKMTKKWIENMKKAVTGISKPNSGVKKKYKIINPNGENLEITGLRKFCRENELSSSMLLRVIQGKQKEYKGYRSGVIV